MVIDGMESLLSHQYFETENKTEMNSDVITAILLGMKNTTLTEPVNFTIQHKKVLPSALTHLPSEIEIRLAIVQLILKSFIRQYLNLVWCPVCTGRKRQRRQEWEKKQ